MSIDQTLITGTFTTASGAEVNFSPSINPSVFRRVRVTTADTEARFDIVRGQQDGVTGFGLAPSDGDVVRWIGKSREAAVTYVINTY
ncbi:MAG: hypothetical protein DRH08_05675 [Deltaproteobacteria bacterium]|nr:MAG: hypothetical protein DRH08_05675 [Deltaproteobacteria bacterium]